MTIKDLIDNYFNDSWDQILPDARGSFSPWREVGMTWEEWSDPHQAFSFLEGLLISDNSFACYWKSIYDKVFIDIPYDNLIKNPFSGINSHFSVRQYAGGCLFDGICYSALRDCLLSIGEKEMIITGGCKEWPSLHLKIPTEFTWHDILKGGYAITSLFNTEDGVFKVFGSRGDWGKISVNAMYPDFCDIVGFSCNDLLDNYESILPDEWKNE